MFNKNLKNKVGEASVLALRQLTSPLITMVIEPLQSEHTRPSVCKRWSRTEADCPCKKPSGGGTTRPKPWTSGSAKTQPRQCRTINLLGFSSSSSYSPQIEGAAHTLHLSIWSFIYTLEANEPSQTLDGQDVNDLNQLSVCCQELQDHDREEKGETRCAGSSNNLV